jgi:hypothetical protein
VRTAEELIECIVQDARIPSGRRRREIQRELRSHMEDLVIAARAAGRDEHDIQRLVLSRFGDPRQIARGFAWVYRHERRALRIGIYTLSTVLLASVLVATILALQAGVAFGLGRPIMQVLASKHTLSEAFDIVASVAIYLGLASLENLFDANPFQKAACLLTLILAALMVSCDAAGLRANFLLYGLVNGVFFRALQLFVTPKIVRTGIVLVCFALAGLLAGLLRSASSQAALAASCASWLVVGVGYQLMTHIAARLDAALRHRLQRIEASY